MPGLENSNATLKMPWAVRATCVFTVPPAFEDVVSGPTALTGHGYSFFSGPTQQNITLSPRGAKTEQRSRRFGVCLAATEHVYSEATQMVAN